MPPPRPCPICGDRHEGDCPYATAEGGAEDAYAPLAFGMDPYAMFDPNVQARMAQLAATTEQTDVMKRLLAITEAQNEELRSLRAEVHTLKGRALPGGRPVRALPAPPPAPKFCQFCGGPLKACLPYCRVHGNENS